MPFFNKLTKEDRTFYLGIVLIISFYIISEYLLFLKGFYAISADESLHTLEAYKLYTGSGTIFSDWLPFQKIIYSIAFAFKRDLFTVPRVISGIFGLLTLISLMDFSFQLFKEKSVVLLTGFFGVIFLPIYLFSVLPMLEIYFFFFTFCSITFYLRWLNKNKNIYLWLTVASVCLNSTTRYESWLFVFLLFLMISIRIIKQDGTQRNKIFLIASIAFIFSIFPTCWFYLSYITTGKVTGFISSVESMYQVQSLFSEIKHNVLYNFFVVNLFSLNLLGVIPLCLYLKKNKSIKHSAILFSATLLFFSAASFLTKAMPTHNFWRLSMVWSLFLVPFTSFCVYFLLIKGTKSNKLLSGFILLFFMLVFSFTIQSDIYTRRSYITGGDLRVALVMNKLLNTNYAKAYISSNKNWYFTNIMVASQEPDKFLLNAGTNYNSDNLTLNLDDKLLADFKKSKVEYLVLKPYIRVHYEKKMPLTKITFTFWDVYKLPF